MSILIYTLYHNYQEVVIACWYCIYHLVLSFDVGFNGIAIHIHCYSHFCTGIYCPVSKGKIVPGVTATGHEGLWRLLYSDYSSTQERVKAELEEES